MMVSNMMVLESLFQELQTTAREKAKKKVDHKSFGEIQVLSGFTDVDTANRVADRVMGMGVSNLAMMRRPGKKGSYQYDLVFYHPTGDESWDDFEGVNEEGKKDRVPS